MVSLGTSPTVPPAEGICRRVYVIGLDGATLTLIRPWVSRGFLPVLTRLMSEGTYGPLESVLPPVSAPAWSTFATGLNPGKHGIFGFRTRIPDSYDMRLVDGRDRAGEPVWHLLNRRGFRVGVVNLPMTYPPESVNGVFISGMDTPGGRVTYTHPPELADELTTQLGEYIIEFPLFAEARRADYDRIWDKIVRNLENRIAAVKYLLTTYGLDFFAVNFRATDSAQHYFWEGADAGTRVLEIYQRLDDFLGWLGDHMPSGTLLLVMSDHGFGPAGERAVLLNRWLIQQGYLAVRSDALQRLPWQRAARWLRYYTPDAIRKWLKRSWPQGFERMRAMSSHILVDWPRTRVYADEQQGMLWINVAGRDPQGVVAPGAEYDALVAELVAQLKDLRDPLTSRPAFSEIYRRDEIYTGPMASLASDLLVSPSTDPPYQLLPSPLATRGEVVVSLEEINTGLPILRGTHRQMGMLAAWGEGVRAGTGELSGLKLMDLAPTILYALGCPLPRDMDGRPLSELFKRPGKLSYEESDVRAQVPPDRDLESEDKSLVLERLRGLGYID